MSQFTSHNRRIRPTIEALEDRQLLAVGALDPTFDGNGKRSVDFAATSDDSADASLIQPDGKILVVGLSEATSSGSRGFALARVKPDGSLDAAFGGGDGRVVTDFGVEAWGHAVALQGSKILVAGRVMTSGSDWGFGVARYNENGTPDTSFGGGTGRIVIDPTSGNDMPVGIAVRGDGKILVGGTVRSGVATTETFGIACLKDNGTLDTEFGVNGYAGLGFTVNGGLQGYAVEATDMELGSGGTILLCGSQFFDTGGAKTYLDVVLARFKADGSGLDLTFNAGGLQPGVIQIDAYPGRRDHAGSMAIQSDGKILVSAASINSQSSASGIALVRVNSNGTLDETFDEDGKVQIQPPGAFVLTSLTSTAVAVQGTSGIFDTRRIVVSATRSLVNERDAFVAQLRNDGSLDEVFSHDGMQTTDLNNGSDDRATDVLLQSDGKVVVVGTLTNPGATNSDFFLARYENDRIAFGAAKYTVAENGGVATITLNRTNGSTGSVSVQVTTSGGTATAGADYAPLSQRVTLEDGETSRTFTVTVHPDAVAEGVETVGLVMSLPSLVNLPQFAFVSLEIENVPAPEAAAPARPRGLVAVLSRVKRKGKTRTSLRIQWADNGELKAELPCPFQGRRYLGVAVATVDSDGDGVGDAAMVSARMGRTRVRRLIGLV